MAKVKKTLTEAAVKKFRPALPGKRDEHYDGLTPGLALRVPIADQCRVLLGFRGAFSRTIRKNCTKISDGELSNLSMRRTA